MSRINTNIPSMNAIHQLIGNSQDLNMRLERLSSGLRINSGKDDPAGLIASEYLRSEMAGLQTAISNSERANSVIATAEGALNEISALLIDIKSMLSQSANKGALAQEEIDANQLQVDSAINTIERIANSTEFEGMKLLNGNLDYVENASSTDIADIKINSAKLIDGAAMTVDIVVSTDAERGTLAVPSGDATEQTTIQIGSNRGTTQLTFANGATQAQMSSAINAVTEVTGVYASGNNLYSVDWGTDAYVQVELINGGAGTGFTSTTDYGVDVVASVNGVGVTGQGKRMAVRTNMLDIEVELTDALNDTSFDISSGGANFSIGPAVDAIGMESIGIQNVAPGQLGSSKTDYGYLSSLKSGADQELTGDNLYTAQRIIDESIKDISTLRGRLGAFQKNTLETNMNCLRVTLENVTASESVIRDADFASETSAMTRAQILSQANTQVLSIANNLPQSVLALLGG